MSGLSNIFETKGVIRKGKPLSVLNGPFTQEGSDEVYDLFGQQVFDFPKPSSLIRYFLSFVVNELEDRDAIILDFFAGSGTTGHAVLDLNDQDGGNRKFILVQLPESTGRTDYQTIAEITKERVRRVIKKLNDENATKLDFESRKHDRGFRVFKLAESNFQPWNANILQGEVAALEQQLALHVDHILDNRTDNDLLYELLLKSGYPLATTLEKVNAAGKSFYSVADGLLLVCLEKELTHDLIKAMADRKPERVVCLDEGFAGNDQLKTNAVQTMKAKGVTSFKTV